VTVTGGLANQAEWRTRLVPGSVTGGHCQWPAGGVYYKQERRPRRSVSAGVALPRGRG
jgi:hypothetical protein